MLDEYQFDIITLNETWVEDYISTKLYPDQWL